jgi:hypothetical protein
LIFVAIVAAIMVAIGYKTNWLLLLFLFFYLYQLMDKTTYLNPIISLLYPALSLSFLPLTAIFLLMPIKTSKPLRKKLDGVSSKYMQSFTFIAGLSKTQSDWLLEAIPLKFGFLTVHLPVIGTF